MSDYGLRGFGLIVEGGFQNSPEIPLQSPKPYTEESSQQLGFECCSVYLRLYGSGFRVEGF